MEVRKGKAGERDDLEALLGQQAVDLFRLICRGPEVLHLKETEGGMETPGWKLSRKLLMWKMTKARSGWSPERRSHSGDINQGSKVLT